MKQSMATVVLAAFAALASPQAPAALISLAYTLNYYYPPNPCVPSSSLTGLITVFDADRALLVPELEPPATACGSDSSGMATFEVGSGSKIFLNFGGMIQAGIPARTNSGAPVFAFEVGTAEVDSLPEFVPDLFVGTIVAGGVHYAAVLPPEFPLFSFASPGTRVGNLDVTLALVPEPATLALLGLGLAGLALSRRRQ